MTKRDWWVATAAALAVSVAAAQAAKPKDEAAAAAAAAMERARKQAANPMRIILEAGKARRRAGDEPPAAPAAEPSVRPVVSRSVATVAVEPPVARAAALPASAPRPAPVVPPPPTPPAPAVGTQVTLNSELAQSRTATAVPALSPAGATTVAAPGFSTLPVAAPALEVAQVRPQLLTMVEPDVPQRLLDGLGRNAAVAVEMTIRPDGSVSNVAVVTPGPRALHRVLVEAVEQWRFAPVAAERTHRVELVFNGDR